MDEDKLILKWAIRAAGAVGIGASLMLFGCPQYRVYNARMTGEAILAQAHGARQALVTQAQAEKDAARLRADAIAIVGQAAKDFPEYRQQEFIGAFAEAMH